MCFLLRCNQNSYIFLLNQLRDIENEGRDEYPVMTTSKLELLIRTEGEIQGNQKLSAYENHRVRRGYQNKERMGHTFSQLETCWAGTYEAVHSLYSHFQR